MSHLVFFFFRNLQLKKIKRTEKKGTESVMDEKFSILFWTDFVVGELKFQVVNPLSCPTLVPIISSVIFVAVDNVFASGCDCSRQPRATGTSDHHMGQCIWRVGKKTL